MAGSALGRWAQRWASCFSCDGEESLLFHNRNVFLIRRWARCGVGWLFLSHGALAGQAWTDGPQFLVPRMPGTALSMRCLHGPSRLTLLFAFCLDVEWTEWFTHDRVSHAKGGEKISDLRAAHPGKICNRPLDIQVPAQNHPIVTEAFLEGRLDLPCSRHLSGVSLTALLRHK